MGKRLTNLTFEEWVAFNFDRPVADPAWYWDFDADFWDGPPRVSIEYITRAFENATRVFEPFSDAQVNQGLWFLVSESGGGIYALFEDAAPRDEKLRCIRSIFTLFERCLAVRCPNAVPHQEKKSNPLNSVCFMWWDIFPTWGKPGDPAHVPLDAEFLDVMRRILNVDADSCRESALHGLGHWYLNYPNEVEEIINNFLNSKPKISRRLRKYAEDASAGSVQ